MAVARTIVGESNLEKFQLFRMYLPLFETLFWLFKGRGEASTNLSQVDPLVQSAAFEMGPLPSDYRNAAAAAIYRQAGS
jgi:hypothetical protein